MTRFDVLSIGSAVQDTFVRSKAISLIDSAESESGQALSLPLGAKIEVDLMQHEIGGAAANTSVSFSRFGLAAAIMTKVGHDLPGRIVRERLEEEKVAVDHLLVDRQDPTGQSVLILSPDGNRTVLVSRGAATNFAVADMAEAFLKRTSWIYLSSIGGNSVVLRRIFGLCQLHHIKIAWNPGSLELGLGIRQLQPLLRQTDVLIMNREEAARLTDMPHQPASVLLRRLIDWVGTGIVVITNGSEGATAFDGQRVETLPGREVKVVDATGAGDSFGSGFVAAHILGQSMDQALSLAIANAESVIGVIGAQPGLLRKKDLVHHSTRRGIGHSAMKKNG